MGKRVQVCVHIPAVTITCMGPSMSLCICQSVHLSPYLYVSLTLYLFLWVLREDSWRHICREGGGVIA